MATKKSTSEASPKSKASSAKPTSSKPSSVKLADVQSREDLDRLSPAARARLGSQVLPDGTAIDAGGKIRDKPFPAADKVARTGLG